MTPPGELTFLHDLAVVLGTAAVTTVVFRKLRQPVVLGYLIAGMVVGPNTWGGSFLSDTAVVQTLAELGVVLLLFSLGLEFSLRRLLRVGPTAALVTSVQVGLMLWVGFTLGELLGWRAVESLFLAAMLSISSTTVIVKAFEEHKVKGRFTELVLGALIVQDLVAILLLAVLTAVGSGANLSVTGFAMIAVQLAVFLVVLLAVGLLFVPRTFRALVAMDRPETLLVAAVGFCFAVALLAERFGYSVALGAFIAGGLVAESGEGKRIGHLVEPVRDVFAAIFFVAVGMLIVPADLLANAGVIALVTVLTMAGMAAGVGFGALLAGSATRTAIRAGLTMAQIGEFSIIIAQLGIALGAVRQTIYPIAVAVTAITAFTTPWLIRTSDPIASWIDARLPHRLQTFVTLYGAWVEQIRTRKRGTTVWARIRRASLLALMDAAVLVAVVILASTAARRGITWSAANLDFEPAVTRWAIAGIGVALCLPFALGIIRCARTIGAQLALQALPDATVGLDLAAAPRRALVVALQLAILVAIGIPLLAITQPFLPPFRGLAVLGVLYAGLGVAFWRSATNLEGHVRAGTQMIVEVLAKQTAHTDDPARDTLQQIHQLLPGFESLVKIEVVADSPASGKTLAELNIRGLTGATVLAVVRDGARVVFPTPQERLQAGDLLAIVGTKEAEAAAEHLLLGRQR